MDTQDELKELYLELCELFHNKAPEVELPFYPRLIRCLEAGQFFIERTDGEITRALWWWAIPSEELPLTEDIEWSPEDISTGDTAYVVNGYFKTGELTAKALWDDFSDSLFAGCSQVASHFLTEGAQQ
jgi:hypothetical protein